MSWNALGLRWLGRHADYLLLSMWGIEYRSAHFSGFFSRDDDWWRNWVLLGN